MKTTKPESKKEVQFLGIIGSFSKICKKVPKILGVEFTQVWTPLERRKQMAVIILWFMMWASPINFGCIIFLILLLSNYVLALLYLGWMYYDRETPETGGRRVECIRNLSLWKHYKNYFPLKLIKTAELDPHKNYLFGAHPHGIFCHGPLGWFAIDTIGFNKIFPNMSPHLLALPVAYKIPFIRELASTFGGFPASRKSMNYLLSYPGGGKIAVLLPGGVSEMMESYPNTDLLTIKNRKGFIKIALQNGAPLVPVYSFGETNIYEQLRGPEGSFIRRIQRIFIKMFGYYVPFINGRGILQHSFGLLPKRIRVTTVVGEPIEIERISQPTQKQIDNLHEKYMNALTALFYKYREECGYPKAELKII